jgi:hypothetical protein
MAPSLSRTARPRLQFPAILIAVVVTWALTSSAGACPTCREGLANDPQGNGLATGFYYSILLMMSAPFAVIGMLGAVAYRSVKRAQAERDADASDQSPD